jgi:hypothetical protein
MIRRGVLSADGFSPTRHRTLVLVTETALADITETETTLDKQEPL